MYDPSIPIPRGCLVVLHLPMSLQTLSSFCAFFVHAFPRPSPVSLSHEVLFSVAGSLVLRPSASGRLWSVAALDWIGFRSSHELFRSPFTGLLVSASSQQPTNLVRLELVSLPEPSTRTQRASSHLQPASHRTTWSERRRAIGSLVERADCPAQIRQS